MDATAISDADLSAACGRRQLKRKNKARSKEFQTGLSFNRQNQANNQIDELSLQFFAFALNLSPRNRRYEMTKRLLTTSSEVKGEFYVFKAQ